MSTVAVAASLKYPELENYIGGRRRAAAGAQLLDVYDPRVGDVITRVPLSTSEAVDEAVRAARAALPAWSAMPIKERVQIFYRYRQLLEQNLGELSALVSEENGKIESEATAQASKSVPCACACDSVNQAF